MYRTSTNRSSHGGGPAARSIRLRKLCEMLGKAALKSKNQAAPRVCSRAVFIIAVSISTMFEIMERPGIKPRWSSDTAFANGPSTQMRTAFARMRFSQQATLSGRVSCGPCPVTPWAVVPVPLGRKIIKLPMNVAMNLSKESGSGCCVSSPRACHNTSTARGPSRRQGTAGGGLYLTTLAYTVYIASVLGLLMHLNALPPRWEAVVAEIFSRLVPGSSL